jgi:molybdopterin synthase catalytic subunit
VLAFATAAAALGGDAVDWELPAPATLADLVQALAAARPALATQLPRCALAVDGALARPGTPLREGAEVALLPPVSGG